MSAPRIYFIKPIGMAGPIKIGCSKIPQSRVEGLSLWSPFPLEVVCSAPGSFQLERALHRQFAHCRSHKEWFHADPHLVDCIALVAAGTPIETAFGITSREDKSRHRTSNSVSELVQALGGPTKAGKVLGGASTQLTWNWAQRGKLPTERYLEQKAILDGLGIQVPDEFWFAPKPLPAPSTTEGRAA